MRVLTLFLRYSITLIILGLVVGIVFREVMLFWATQQVKSAVNRIDLLSHRSEEYVTQCREKGGGRNGGGIRQFQVRFLTSRDYQVDIVCDFFTSDPIVVEQHTLPMFVEKVPGHSGFIWDPEGQSGITLEIFGRRNTLILDGQKVVLKQGTAEITGNQPETVCKGYGYACCDDITHVGVGDPFYSATDCPQTCFSACQPRPNVLKFTSDPTPDINTRTITINRNDQVTFYYVADIAGAQSPVITIHFGDGSSQEMTEKDGNYTHQYTCEQTNCQYTATVTVLDMTQSTESVITPLSTITVNVN